MMFMTFHLLWKCGKTWAYFLFCTYSVVNMLFSDVKNKNNISCKGDRISLCATPKTTCLIHIHVHNITQFKLPSDGHARSTALAVHQLDTVLFFTQKGKWWSCLYFQLGFLLPVVAAEDALLAALVVERLDTRELSRPKREWTPHIAEQPPFCFEWLWSHVW